MNLAAAPQRLPEWLICLLVLAGSSVAHAQETATDPPGRVARLSLIEGEVSFAPAGTDEWVEALVNRPITSEDRLWVGADGRAELQVGAALVHLDRDTQFGFIELDDEVMQMSLVDGAATVRVRRLAERETIKIETPNATIHLRSVGEYHIEAAPDSDRTIVKTRNGEAEVSSGSTAYTVRAGEQGVFSGLETLAGQIDALGPRTPFEAWANDRDRRQERAQSARYVSRDIVGYEDLDEHGEWIHEREYGYVWRPIYVAADWAPYRFGRWAWISPWGWTWIDDARWGFAPFHYGRWTYVRHRWCWVPGPRHLRPIYAPALVGWLGGPSVSVSVSFGDVGWYPLGPYEIYAPGYRHTPHYLRRVNVSNTIIVNNTYITNVYGGRGHFDHRYRERAHAVTAVHRDRFVGGERVNTQRVRLSDGELRRWRSDPRPPAIAPYRESVLAGRPREHRQDRNGRLDRDWLTHRGRAERVDFAAERRAIETNGGRPVSRAQLIEPPKARGDFRVARPDEALRTKRDSATRSRPGVDHGRPAAAPAARAPHRSDREPAHERARFSAVRPQNEQRMERRPVETRPAFESAAPGRSTRQSDAPSMHRSRPAPERRAAPPHFENRTGGGRSAEHPPRTREPEAGRAASRPSSPPPQPRLQSHESSQRSARSNQDRSAAPPRSERGGGRGNAGNSGRGSQWSDSNRSPHGR